MGLKSTTVCLGYQQITSLSSAQSLTVPLGATLAVVIPEGIAVRWRDDGVDPTGAVGMPLALGTVLSYDGDLSRIRFIQQAASATLNVSYYA
jgi:hypothetical protein